MAEYDLAVADYLVAGKANPKNVWPLLLIGEIMEKKGQPSQALEYFNKAIKKNPGFSKGYLYRGDYYLGQKKYNLALADFNKLINVSKYDPEAYYKRALTLENGGRHREALTDYQQFLELASRENPRLDEVKAKIKELESPWMW